MYKVTWNVYWGTRHQDTFVTKYFRRRPSKDEIIRAFRHSISNRHFYEGYDEPGCSGMVVVSELVFEDQ